MPAVVNAVSAVRRELRKFGLVTGELTGRTVAYVS